MRVSEVRFTKRGNEVIGVQLVASEEEGLTLLPNDIVQLLHRPRPEGKTEGDMLDEVLAALRFAALCKYELLTHEGIPRLRMTLNAYELSKPLESVSEPKMVPTKPRSIRLDDPAGGC